MSSRLQKMILFGSVCLATCAQAQDSETLPVMRGDEGDFTYSMFSNTLFHAYLKIAKHDRTHSPFQIDLDENNKCVVSVYRAHAEGYVEQMAETYHDAVQNGKTQLIRRVSYSETIAAGVHDQKSAADYAQKDPRCQGTQLNLQ